MIDEFLKSDALPELKSSVLSFYDTPEEKEELEQINSENGLLRAIAFKKSAKPFLTTTKAKGHHSSQYKRIRRI